MSNEKNMPLFEAILKRRSCRRFSNQPVEFEKILEVITAGLHAPSSGNLQNWQFIIVTEKQTIRELYHHTLEQEVFLSAPVAIIVCGDNAIAEIYYGLRGKRLYTIQNCAACIQNMLLAATALGLGSCWVGAFDEEKIASLFDIPQNVRAQAIVLLGYSDTEPEPKEQKRLENVVFFNKYGQVHKKPHLIYRDYSKEWEYQFRVVKQHWQEIKHRLREQKKEEEKRIGTFLKETGVRVNRIIESLKDEEKARRRKR